LKISKEFKAGLIAVLSIGLLVGGVNFLKGNSFFGGDDQYVAYFPNSGGLGPATSVYVNGVIVGKVLSVDYNNAGDSASKVKVVFNIQEDGFKIPRGSKIEIGSFDLFNKGILLTLNPMPSKGYYTSSEKIFGTVAQDMMSQVKAYADPITQKLQVLMGTVDKTVNSMKGFWDTTATSQIQESMQEVKIAIKRFGNVAVEVEDLVSSEKAKMAKIFSNLESITYNLKASNDKIAGIIGNTKKITDDLVSVEYKSVILDAQNTIKKLNLTLEEVNSGNGSIGKLLKDDQLYNELVNTNKELQELVDDITIHPERYIHFSVLGAKTKGAPLTTREEKKLRKLLDSIPD
jgi:phospholipid/cholesterol/gamma-HCH transport system substrate-binding protein